MTICASRYVRECMRLVMSTRADLSCLTCHLAPYAASGRRRCELSHDDQVEGRDEGGRDQSPAQHLCG